MRFLLDRKPDRDSELFAEASALMDDGLDADFVLGLYPDDAEWLAPLLATGAAVTEAAETEQPSYFFEASLKSKFLAAAREGQQAQAAPRAVGYQPQSSVRTAVASAGIMVAAGVMGILTLGFVTSDQAVPGDWNYSFKRAQERVEYALARGDNKVDVQIDHTRARVAEISKRGENASAGDVKRLTSELAELEDLALSNDLDPLQRAEIESVYRSVKAVLPTVEKQAPAEVVRTANEVNERVYAAASGGAASLPSPTPTPSPTASATASTTPEPTETATVTETPTAETETPTPEVTAEPTETETETPTQSATEPIENETPGAVE